MSETRNGCLRILLLVVSVLTGPTLKAVSLRTDLHLVSCHAPILSPDGNDGKDCLIQGTNPLHEKQSPPQEGRKHVHEICCNDSPHRIVKTGYVPDHRSWVRALPPSGVFTCQANHPHEIFRPPIG